MTTGFTQNKKGSWTAAEVSDVNMWQKTVDIKTGWVRGPQELPHSKEQTRQKPVILVMH